MNYKLNKIISSTLAITLATATVFTTGIVANASELTPVEKTENENGEVVVQSTDKSTEYTSIPEKVEEALPEVSAEPVLNVNSIEEIDSKDTINETSDSIFKSCRLIVTNPTDVEFKEESLGTDNIVSVQRYEDKYFVTYRSVFATEKAYNDLTALGLDVEIDVVQDTPEGVDIKDDKGNDIEAKNIALAEEVRPTKSVEDLVSEDTQKNEKTIVVAVLDTGLNNEEAIFDNKVIEGKNFVDDKDTKDLDGHGTTMSRIVLDTADSNVKILPIKVLNDEGKGTTLSAYKGIKYVIEKKKENPSLDFVINLSMSGIGHSKLLESAINEAYNNNIPVVVSAGNDNKDVSEYTPANIDSAFTIASADKNNNVIEKTLYSNFGANVDYSANGHYEYVRTVDDKEVVTKVDGTSVSSAYVSSYIAMLKQMALSDDNEDNDNLSIADIDTSLSESAIKFEDTTLGKGYLEKENIIPKKIGEVKRPEKTLPVEDVNSINENIELCKQDWITDGIMKWDSYRLAATNEKGLQTLLSAYYDSDGQYSAMWAWWYTNYGVGWDWKTIVVPYDISVTSQKYSNDKQAKFLQGWKNNGGNATIKNNIPEHYSHYQASINIGGKSELILDRINMDGNNHKIIYDKTGNTSNNTSNIFINPKGTLTASNSNFYNTQALEDGQTGITSIFNNRGTVNLTKCKVYNNESGIYVGGETTETDCDIYNNDVVGIHVDGASSSSSNCRIENNGIVGIFSVGNVNLKNNTIITAGKGKECLQNIYDGTVNSKGTTFKNGRVLNFGTFTSEDDEISNVYTTGISNLANFGDMYGKGVLNIKGKTQIHDCNGIGLENVACGTCTIEGGSITANKTGIDNGATLKIKDGSINNNKGFGVNNWNIGTVKQTGGSIYSNKGTTPEGANGGVLQNGTYNINGNAKIDTNNSVYLANKNAVLNINGAMTNTDNIVLTTATTDRTVGRKLVTASNQSLADSNSGRFRLAYNAPQKNNNGTTFDGVADDPDGNAFCRAGSLIQDNNYSNSAMFLSGKYYVKYNNNLINNNLYIRSVSPEKTFWKENKEFHTGESPGVFLQDNNGAIHDIANTNNGLVFKGWKKPFDNNLYTTNQIFNFDTNSEFTAVWDTNFAINYLGNGATNGEDFKEYNISQGYRFAENPFSKELKGYKDDLLHRKPNAIEFKDKYSHQGWSKDPSATYKDNVYKCGAELDTFKFLVDSLSDGSAYIDDEGQVVVDLNAVWDEYPVINSKEIYLPNNLDNGKYASEKAMLKLAKAIAVDDNDGDSNGKDVSLRIVDFDLDDFKNRGKETHIKLQLEAIDQVGNRTIDYISIVLVETNLNIMEDYGYVRFIDEENYNKRDDSLPDGGQSNGALMKDSSWYLDPERVQIITTGFANIRTLLDDDESNDSYVMRYSFPRSEMIKSNNYKNTYGRGNFKSDEYERINGKGSYQRDFGVRSALDGWCKEFEHCKVK